MLTKLVNGIDNIVEILASGGAIPRLWVVYFGFGAAAFGLLSFPSSGVAIVLIPLFLLAGLLIIYGCLVAPRREENFEKSRKYVMIGMVFMILASWTRGILVLGLEQPGNDFLGSVVWLWITIGCIFLFIAVGKRGMR